MFTKLTYLKLNDNRIKTIDRLVLSNPKFSMLDLSSNALESIQELRFNNSKQEIKALFLDNNCLTNNMPLKISNLARLEWLSMSHMEHGLFKTNSSLIRSDRSGQKIVIDKLTLSYSGLASRDRNFFYFLKSILNEENHDLSVKSLDLRKNLFNIYSICDYSHELKAKIERNSKITFENFSHFNQNLSLRAKYVAELCPTYFKSSKIYFKEFLFSDVNNLLQGYEYVFIVYGLIVFFIFLIFKRVVYDSKKSLFKKLDSDLVISWYFERIRKT
jgi:hypothetical protein